MDAEKRKNGTAEISLLENELRRVRFREKYRKLLRSTVSALIVTAAAASLIATLILPILRIYGSSMMPTLAEGDIIAAVKTNRIERGDIICFYYSNRILVKRVIGLPLDTVSMDEDGNFYLNGSETPLEEPYLSEKDRDECDAEFPLQVPEGAYFVAGDHRKTSIDSRSSAVGFVTEDEIVGKVLFTVWPLPHFGWMK